MRYLPTNIHSYILVLIALAALGSVTFLASPALFGNGAGTELVAAVAEVPTEQPAPALVHADHYFEVMEGCNYAYEGDCVNVRSGPSTDAPIVARLRVGVVLKIGETVSVDGRSWHKVLFEHALLYPERVTSDWYVAADVVRSFGDRGDLALSTTTPKTTKRIVVDISKQMLFAYDGDTLFMQQEVSTGLDFTPTPHGTFTIFKKTPSRFMQGPIPNVSDQVYDLPGVPWNLYFTAGGAVIHGAYWHNHFGTLWSHGCVNLPLAEAQKLYMWADVGTSVTVQN